MLIPILLAAALFVIFTPTLFVLGLLTWHILKVGVRKFFSSMPTEETEMDYKPKQYRKVIRTDPPALVRIKELGWYMPCGHHAYEWSGDKQQCLQCVLEGRVASRDMGRQS